jgi:class 3 adenylate cyclase
MEPQVQYAKTSDGVDIAFASAGEGPPLIRVPMPGVNHVQRDWAMFPDLWPPLAEAFRLIIYDPRGTGLSDRDAIDFSMEAMIRDLEAVVDRMGLQSFAVMAVADAVPIAVTYAAISPNRVSHLILIDGWTSVSDFVGTPVFETHKALIDQDWTLYTETLVRVLTGMDEPRLIESFGEHIRATIEPEAWRSSQAAIEGYDVSALLSDVRAETLVLHNNNSRMYPVRAGQKLAAGVPDARFLAIDDVNLERVAPMVEEFAGRTLKSAAVDPGAFRTILFTDVKGSTALTDRLGDKRARDLLREHESVVREALKAHGGSEVKTMGDGFMASFSSATKALECAIAIQRSFAERNDSADEPIKVRIGLNAGEPIAEVDPGGRGDLFGTAVNMAARIAGKADGGEILASNVVRELVAGKDFLFNDRGETELRGFEDPVRVYEVRWRE